MSDAYRRYVEQMSAQAEVLAHTSEAATARAGFLLRTARGEPSTAQTNQ